MGTEKASVTVLKLRLCKHWLF